MYSFSATATAIASTVHGCLGCSLAAAATGVVHRSVNTGSANGADYLRSCDANKSKQIHNANDKMDKDERGVLCGTQFLRCFSQFRSYLLLLETEAVTGEEPTVGSAYDAWEYAKAIVAVRGCQR